MLRFLADENFNNNIVRGLFRRMPTIDLVRAQDVGLSGVSDFQVLAWAADHGRIVLTHDVSTMATYAFERIAQGLTMPGLFEISRSVPVGPAIDDLLLLTELSLDGEWDDVVLYLPLR